MLECSACEKRGNALPPFTEQEALLTDSHEGASLCRCNACGGLFVRLWREVGGWGVEDLWRYWAPVSRAESDELRAAFVRDGDDGMARAIALILARPHLVEAPTGSVRWSAADFEVGLWMHT